MTPQVRVDQFVHSQLKKEKKPGESFNDAIIRLLDIDLKLDDLTSYMGPDAAGVFRRCVTAAENTANVRRQITNTANREALELIPVNSADPILKLVVDEHARKTMIYIQYRGQTDILKRLGRIETASGNDELRLFVADEEVDSKELAQAVRSKAEQAANKWG